MPALTPSQTIGPFFLEGFKWALELAAPPAAGVRVSGRVLDRDGKGVSDALIEIWQPDWRTQQALAGWQRVATDDDGPLRVRDAQAGEGSGACERHRVCARPAA